MSRSPLTRSYNWELIRTRWEEGESAYGISKSPGAWPSKQGILNRAQKEGWVKKQDIENDIERLPINQEDWDSLKPAQQMVIEAFSKGVRTIEQAALRAGVSESTVRRWRQDKRFGRLCQAARALARDKLVKRIEQFGQREWRPNAWLLERLEREEFGAQVQPVMQGNTFNILGQVNLGIDRQLPQRELENTEDSL